MNKLRPYLFSVLLGVVVFVLLETQCSTKEKVYVPKKYYIHTDTTEYKKTIDSLNNVILVQARKKNPLLDRQKTDRKRVDSLVQVYVVDPECDEDSVISLLHGERAISDSVQKVLTDENLALTAKTVVVENKNKELLSELVKTTDTLNIVTQDLNKTKLKLDKVTTQRKVSVGVAILLFVLTFIK